MLEDKAEPPAVLERAKAVTLAPPMVAAEPEATPVRVGRRDNMASRDGSAHVPWR
ncbi:Sensor protein (fragment) [Bradyrhizobium sp. STM 3809]